MQLSLSRRALVVAALVVASTGAAATAVASPPPSGPSYTAQTGLAPRIAHHATKATSRHPSAAAKGARAIPHLRAATATSSPTAAAPRATSRGVLTSFNGVSSRDSMVTNFNAEFEPPDQGLCVGNGYILEAVNSAYRIYRTNGTTVRGPFNVNDLFDEGAAEFTSDPRCYFDTATGTWFAEILFIDFNTGESRVDLAVNTSGDPTSLWTQYRIDTTDDGRLGEPNNPGCPCLGDQPLFGIDQHNVYLSTNEFSINGPEFNGAQIYAIAKSDLLAGRSTAHFVHFGHLKIAGTTAASVQPASNRSAVPAEFFLSSLDPNGTFDSRLGVWAITGGEKVASGGKPKLSSTVIRSEVYGIPPSAVQKASSSRLDSGDDRMQQAQYIGGRLWGTLTTAVTIPHDPTERAGAAWFSVVPTLRGGVVSGARIDRQGYVVKQGSYLLYPALQSDAAGDAAMVFTLTGAQNFPSAAYATLRAQDDQFASARVAAAGTGPYSRASTRWGDYSYAALNTAGSKVWLATEYVPPVPSQTPDRKQNWGTRVFDVPLR